MPHVQLLEGRRVVGPFLPPRFDSNSEKKSKHILKYSKISLPQNIISEPGTLINVPRLTGCIEEKKVLEMLTGKQTNRHADTTIENQTQNIDKCEHFLLSLLLLFIYVFIINSC